MYVLFIWENHYMTRKGMFLPYQLKKKAKATEAGTVLSSTTLEREKFGLELQRNECFFDQDNAPGPKP